MSCENSMDEKEEETATVWALFKTHFSYIFREDYLGEDVKKITNVLKNLCCVQSQTALFVPSKQKEETEWDFKKRCMVRIAQVIWLLGQLMQIVCRKRLSKLHQVSIEAQISILGLLAEKNNVMFKVLIMEYIKLLEEILNVRDAIGKSRDDKEYKIVRFHPHYIAILSPEIICAGDYKSEEYPFIISFRDDCSVLLETLLPIISSQTPMLVNCSESISLLCCLIERSLQDESKNVVIETVNMMANLAHLNVFNTESSISTLNICQRLGTYIRAFEPAVDDSLVSRDLEAFKRLFDAFIETNGTCHPSLNKILLDSLIPLVEKDSSFMRCDIIAQSISKLIAVLLPSWFFGNDNILKTQVKTHLTDVSYCLKIMPILEELVKKEMNAFSEGVDPSDDKMIVDRNPDEVISLMDSELWKCLCDSLVSKMEILDQSLIADEELIKLISSVVQSAANLTGLLNRFQDGSISAFNNGFYSSVASLAYNSFTATDFQCFQHLISVITDLLLLPESENMDVDTLKRLVIFLSLPIAKKCVIGDTVITSQLKNVLAMIENEQYNPIIDKVQKDCVVGLGRMVGDVEVAFRVKLLVECFNKKMHSSEVIKSVPFLLKHMNSLYTELDEYILQPSLSIDEFKIPACEAVSALACIMSNTGYLKRVDGQCRVRIMCKECDLGIKEGQLSSNSQIHILLKCVLELLSSTSSEVLLKIIPFLPRFANHLSLFHTLDCVNRWIVLIKHPNNEVRESFVKVVADLLFKKKWIKRHEDCVIEEVGLLSQYDRQELMNSELLLTSFKTVAMDTVFDSLVHFKKNLQVTTMAAIGKVGMTPLDFVLYPTFKMLLMYVLHPNSSVGSTVVYLQKIAEKHNKLLKEIFFKYRGEFCKQLADMLLIKKPLNKHTLSGMFVKFSRALSYEKEEMFLAQNASSHLLKYILHLVLQKPDLEWIIYYIGDKLEKDVSSLMKEGFQHIYPYFYMNESADTLAKVCEITENLTGKTREALIKSCYKTIVCEILLHIHGKKERVLEALDYLKSDVFTHEEYTSNVIEFLAPRFLGVVGMMESRLVSRDSSDSEKKNVLLALPEIFALMGAKHITPVRLRIIAMLREALKLCHSSFPELTCDVWVAFFHSVDLKALAPLMSTIFISLLPLLENFSKIVGRIFHFLVIENHDEVSSHIHELSFVPNHESIQEVYEVIQKKIEEHKNLSVRKQFKVAIKIASHENVDVRLHGLKRLQNYLASNRAFISDLILNNDSLDPTVIEFFEAVITGSRDENEDIRMACGECLGSLGALDPGYLTGNLILEKNNQQEPMSISGNGFAIAALLCLTKALQEARHTFLMDCLALAIQELLKIYNISPNSPIWKEFPEEIQNMMMPFLKTRYLNCQNAINRPAINTHPIFGSNLGNTVKSWAYNWATFLIPLTSPDEFASRVFNVCHPSLKKDMQVLLFFIPYIFLHAVLHGTEENLKRIEEEIMAVLCWYEREKSTEKKVVLSQKVRRTTIKFETLSQSDQGLSTAQNSLICTKIVYSLIDFLHRWQKETEKKFTSLQNSQNKDYKTVCAFLKRFPLIDIAEGSIHCQEYARALMYLEEFALENPKKLQDLLPTFGKIYSYLKEPDGLRGVIAIHEREPAPEEMILYHTLTGHLHDAATCYESLSHQNDGEYLKGMVKCYLSMDQPCTALKIAEAVIYKDKCNIDLYGEQAEAVWSLGLMDQLEHVLRTPGKMYEKSWGISIGKAILHLRNEDKPAMVDQLHAIKKSIIQQVSTATVTCGGYRQGYDYIVKLHILDEFEKMGNSLLDLLAGESSRKLAQFEDLISNELEQRLKLLQPTHHVLQPVLCMRRVVLTIAKDMLDQKCPSVTELLKQVVSKCWLKSISLARKSCNFQQAYSNILTVQKLSPKALFIEEAKLHWAKSECQTAITTLRWGIEKHFPNVANLSDSERMLLAKAKLLVAKYNDANMNIDLELNLKCYREAVDICKKWEKSLACLAQFKYRVFRESKQDDNVWSKSDLDSQLHIINYFGKSLEYGRKYIYQSMPRMLEIWLDFGTIVAKNRKSKNHRNLAEQENTLTTMIKVIEEFLRRLPIYTFMTAMSQLISRVCHPHPACFQLLTRIVIDIMKAFPHQALWMMMFVCKSNYSVRGRRCETIFNSIKDDVKLTTLIKHYKQLTGKLVELSGRTVDERTKVTSVKVLLAALPKLFETPGFSEILMPAQKFQTLSLPRSADYNNHNPFPQTPVYIRGVKDELQILVSLQRPKRIVFLGTDGLEYPMLLKSRDDLRIDSRMMEFNRILNMYLQRTPEARDRRLHINTYNVMALSESCGLIEWLGNLVCLRHVIMKLLKQKGVPRTDRDKMSWAKTDPLAKKRQIFLEKQLPRHPPVLREWFLQEFPHPNSWYQARSAFVRSSAVMSMVGYMVGLGDRHGENILLDSITGGVTHVDFNALFNKGERMEIPEVVPFRLTHNMVTAMGPTGYEGMFVEACEITVRLMRAHIEQLLSVVRPFIYDPLVDWNRNSKRDEYTEMTNELARENILDIQHRLLGHVRNNDKVFTERVLSVEGQTQTLIAEATSIDNLCQMFIGWGPFL
ncbi:hypothetical protein LSTR_LSTR000215 [Laodelphax striatellus]|uniref:Serine/threonine-protein kinase ATR n=1 Tax=Laodelphax striatellus TaxID=195883 RepID=A0A482X857_LAOST|nr:hypothetical protein LSTR_LSTR000215 [Laodelphax striatellus]